MTARELEIATIIAEQGIGTHAIAMGLGVTSSTVETHLRSISSKLSWVHGTNTRERIVRWYFKL